MSRPVTAKHTVEVELTLTGTFQPGAPEEGPSFASGGQPAEPAHVEDAKVTGAAAMAWESGRHVRPPGGPVQWVPGRYVARSILDGVNPNSPDVQRLLSNLLDWNREGVEEALIDNADDGARPDE